MARKVKTSQPPTDKNAGGRPPKFTDPAEMQVLIDAYFKKCDTNVAEVLTKKGDLVKITDPIPYTISGLTLALGFCSRQSLLDYSKKPVFMDTIKAAKLACESNLEVGMLKGRWSSSPAIFDLKNNFGWIDNYDHAHSGSLTMKYEDLPDDELKKIIAKKKKALKLI